MAVTPDTVSAIGVTLIAMLSACFGYAIGKSVGAVEEFRDEQRSAEMLSWIAGDEEVQ